MATPHSKPLSGLLVVALEQVVAAPMATRRLADAGARVIKIERPEGDAARGLDQAANGESSYFVWLNRGKESVTMDLRRPEDRDLFEAMLARADVFIQNLRPGAVAKLGYAVPELVERYPRLVACSISGFGETGPYADRKAYDLLIQAEAGLAHVTGGPEAPSRVGVSVVDIATGMNAYEAILEALIGRGVTGRGADIVVSMFDAMAEWMAVPMLHGEAGTPPQRIGLAHPSVAPYGVFQSSDGVAILISIQNDRDWRVFAKRVLGRPGLADDPRFSTNIARAQNRTETDELVATFFARHDTTALVALMMQHDIAFGRVSDIAGLLAHPHLTRVAVETEAGTVRLPVPPARRRGTVPEFGPVPMAGQHTAAVRREFLGR